MKPALIALSLLVGLSTGYSGSFLNLHSPSSGVSQGDFEFSMNHRFYGEALKDEPFESFFGMDDGANVRLSFRYYPAQGFAVGLSHERAGSTNTIFGEWSAMALEKLEFGIQAGYESIKPSSTEDREGGFLVTGSASILMLQDKLRPVLNLAFDEYSDNSGLGFGIDFQAAERFAIFGEYYPSVEENVPEDCFAFGGRYSTWGHQFLLGLTNSPGIGIYEMLPGSYTGDLSFALSVRRLF